MQKTIFKNFSIRNGICIEEADIPLENQGVVFIKGENLDEGGSNGAGKSSLFETLCYACIGENSKGMHANDLLHLDDPKNLHLALDFEREHNYRIEHFRAHSVEGTKIRVSVDGDDCTPKSSKSNPKAAQLFATECVGLSPREIYGSLYLRQKFSHAMISGTPTEKRNLISAYFGLDTIDSYITTTTKRIKAIQLPEETRLVEMKTGIEEDLQKYNISDLDTKIAEAEVSQRSLQQRLITLRVDMDNQLKARDVSEQRVQLENKLLPYNLSFYDNLDKEIEQINNDLQTIRKYQDILASRLRLEKELEVLGAKPDTSYENISADLSTLNSNIIETEKMLKDAITRVSYEKQLESLPQWQVPKATLEEQIQLLRQQLDSPVKEFALKQSELAQLKKLGNVCDRCFRPISHEDHEKLINERVSRLAELGKVIEDTNKNLEEFVLVLEQTNNRLHILGLLEPLASGDPEKLATNISDFKKQREALSLLSQKIIRITSLSEQLAALPHICETKEQLQITYVALDEKLHTLKNAHSWFLRNGHVVFDINALGRIQSELNNSEAAYNEVTNNIAQWREQKNTYARLQEQLSNITAMLDKSSIEKNRSKVLEVVHVVLKDIRKMKLRESTELLTQVLPSNIRQLYPKGNIGIEVTDEGGELDIFLRKGNKLIPMKFLSGGQEKRVGIAIVFSFAKMGSHLTNLLLADEPFKDLDSEGRAAVYDLIMDLGMDTILLTAHDADIGIDSKYDQTWTIRMQNGKSKLYR